MHGWGDSNWTAPADLKLLHSQAVIRSKSVTTSLSYELLEIANTDKRSFPLVQVPHRCSKQHAVSSVVLPLGGRSNCLPFSKVYGVIYGRSTTEQVSRSSTPLFSPSLAPCTSQRKVRTPSLNERTPWCCIPVL